MNKTKELVVLKKLYLLLHPQWRIQGRAPPLFFDQNEAQRAEKNVFGEPLPPSPLSEGLDLPLIHGILFNCIVETISCKMIQEL